MGRRLIYQVDPSHVRNQTESIGDSIGEHELLTEKMEKVKKWRAVLKEVATRNWVGFAEH